MGEHGRGLEERAASEASDGALSTDLASCYARGRAAFPQLAVEESGFVRHLSRVLGTPGARSLATLAVEDLYLAYACLSGVEGSAAAFEASCASAIRAALAGATSSAVERDDIEQQVRAELLVGSPRTGAKIGSYRGEASLARFAAVAARRLAISTSRSTKSETWARRAASIGDHLSWQDPAIALVKENYREQFRAAVEDAIAAADQRDRLLLRLHLVEGATTRRIAKMYRVSQPTASRWLESARQHVAAEVERLLRERLQLTAAEIRSIARLIESELDLSLSRLLSQR